MLTLTESRISAAAFELRYAAAGAGCTSYAFPCDAQGHVDLDALSPHDRTEYLFARAMAGREVAWPVVVPVHADSSP